MGKNKRTSNKQNNNSISASGPAFLIIGAQKAGTTALYTYLSKHPSIAEPKSKEIHYFSVDARYEKGIDYYHSFFNLSSTALNFEASPSYLMNEAAPQRIYQYNSDIKLIVLLRDPIIRAYSAWNMYKNRYEENRNWFFDDWLSWQGEKQSNRARRNDSCLLDFEHFVLEELDHFNKTGAFEIEAPVIPQGIYARYLKRYYKLFPQRQILVLENREMLSHTRDVLRNVEDFLEVNPCEWRDEDLRPVFTGDYSRLESEVSLGEIIDFYRSCNEELFELIQKKYAWIA